MSAQATSSLPLARQSLSKSPLQLPEIASRNWTLAQSKWDQFYEESFYSFDDLNPELRRDKALNKTIRALGQRPRAPLTQAQREDLKLSREVAWVLEENNRQRNTGIGTALSLAQRCSEEDYFESLCDEACEG